MLGSHNILNPANGAPITVPSQDMVLGLYYITKLRPGDKGEGHIFYGPEEAQIAYNEGRVTLHAPITIMVDDVDDNGNKIRHLVEKYLGGPSAREPVCTRRNRLYQYHPFKEVASRYHCPCNQEMWYSPFGQVP